MDPELSVLRRAVLITTIGSFTIAALMGVAALLGGGEFGETEGRILMTTLVIGCASILILCDLASGLTPYRLVGALGAVAVLVPLGTALMLIWSDWDDLPGEATWKTFGVGLVVAATLAQASLLLALAWKRPSLGLLLFSTLAVAAVLAVLISSLILGEYDGDGVLRIMGIVAILDVLGTLLTIALAVFTGPRREPVDAGVRPAPETGLSVRLSDEQASLIEQLSRSTGRSPAHLVADAVDQYLRSPAG